MKMHVIGSLREFDDDIDFIRTILKTLRDNRVLLAHNWVDAAADRRKRQAGHQETSFDWQELVDTNISILKEVDALIVEGSRFNYSQGFQTAIALQNKKPVLNLYREDLPEYKEWPDKLFVSGISHPLFTSKPYKTQEDLEKIVGEFIDGLSAKTHELDIKLALDAPAYEKLDQPLRARVKAERAL